MGAKEWLATYYPTPADKVQHEEALAHSLRKWEGLRPEVLEAHGLYSDGWSVFERGGGLRPVIRGGSSSCALCERFYNHRDRETPCAACPLAIARGGVPCDERMDDETSAPWGRYTVDKDPEPMIGWLRVALETQGAPA